MQPTDSLFRLVRSLTPAEKRYFKSFAKRHIQGGKSAYEKLFDALDHAPQEHYDEKQFIKTHRNKPFAKYFADEKRNLHELIMKAMRTLYAEDSIDRQIAELLADEDFFRKKRLNDLRTKVLEKAKKLAYKYEKYTTLLAITEREMNARIEWNQDELMDLYNNLGKEEVALLHVLDETTRLKHLNQKLFVQVRINTKFGSEKLKAESEQTINHPLIVQHQLGHSFTADGYYYRILSLHHRIQGNGQQHKHFAQCAYELFEQEYPHQKASAPIAYRVALFNYINACFVAGELVEVPQLLQQAKLIETTNADEEGEEWQNLVHLELLYLLNTQQLDKAMHMAPTISAGLAKYKTKVNTARQLAITYNLATAFFISQHWSEALACYNSIVADSTNARADLKENSELLLLAVHFELKNWVLLSNLIVNLRRRFNAAGNMAYNPFFSSLKQMISGPGNASKTGSYGFEQLPGPHKELNLWITSLKERRSIRDVFIDTYSLASTATKQ